MAAGHFGRLDCAACEEEGKPDGSNELKDIRQCEGGPDRFLIPVRPKFELERCPMSYLDKGIERAFFLYGHFKEGRLPIAGGVLDQVRTGLEAFRLIDEYSEVADRK